MAVSTILTSIGIGFSFYDSALNHILTTTFARNITLSWTQIMHSAIVPANCVYMRIYVDSNLTDGVVNLDNFETEL